MSLASNLLVVGKIGAPHGVKGWVRINSYTQENDNIFNYAPWFLKQADGSVKEIKVDQWRHQAKHLVAKLVEVDDRDDAELIKNVEIYIDSTQLPELDNDYYWKDLVGMQVVNTNGYHMGTVKELFETGANDVMLVKAKINDAFGQKERLLPFLHDSVVLKVDKEANLITVDWDPAF